MVESCAVCTKTVYPVERIAIDDKVLHKTCLKCAHCKTVLSLGKYAAINGQYYCKPHFKQLFALKGNYSEGFAAAGEAPVTTGNTSDKDFFKAPLESTNSAKLFNLKTVASDSPKSPVKVFGKVEVAPSPKSPVKVSDMIAARNQLDRTASSTENLSSPTKLESFKDSRGSVKNLAQSFGSKHDLDTKNSGSKQDLHETGPKKTFVPPAQIGTNSNKCSSCTKTAYPNEAISVDGVVFHKSCFKCAHCNNCIKLGNYASLEGKYYCKPHFKQLFALSGNYNEGFGTRPHKEKWNPKEIVGESS